MTHELESMEGGAAHLLNSIIVPRPIALITTQGENGVINAAPFSYFNAVCTKPPIVSVSVEKKEHLRKHTAHNILTTKEYVINICSVEMASTITIVGKEHPQEISEVDAASLSLIPSHRISPPRIANTLIHLECVLLQAIEVGDHQSELILGTVVKVHLHHSILDPQGGVDIKKLNPIARLAGKSYASLSHFIHTD